MSKAHNALKRAIQAAGGQAALAAALGLRQSHVWYWLHKSGGGVPAEHVPAVADATGVARHELRPDLFSAPVAASGLSEDSASYEHENDSQSPVERSGHFTRYKHHRRPRFRTAQEIEDHLSALREEWSHR
jgi:DNA-binding transcriptional regulator YdaS (Cro superfamily)